MQVDLYATYQLCARQPLIRLQMSNPSVCPMMWACDVLSSFSWAFLGLSGVCV